MIHILLIDDDARLRDSLSERLRAEGFEVSVAENRLEALEIYGAMPADLVITDIYMPEFDGLETITALRRIANDLKVIAISRNAGSEGRDYLRTARAFGAARIFTKPVRPAELLTAINELLNPEQARET